MTMLSLGTAGRNEEQQVKMKNEVTMLRLSRCEIHKPLGRNLFRHGKFQLYNPINLAKFGIITVSVCTKYGRITAIFCWYHWPKTHSKYKRTSAQKIELK